jgi:hypothetical protein
MIWPGDQGISGNDPRAWDPANQSISTLTPPGYDLFCAGHSFLADGRLFVAGGHIQNGVGLANASIYDPVANAWTALPAMNAGRWYPTVTVLANGDVLVVSGSIDNTVGSDPVPQVFQLGSGTWRNLAQLGQELYPMMLLAPNGKVFNPAPTRTTRYLDTASGTWSAVANRAGPYRDYGSAVMYAPGKVLVIGGGDPPTNTAEVIDLNQPSPTWRAVGSMAFARRQLTATLLPDGNVLVTGGTSSSGFNNPAGAVHAAELWNPTTEQWTTLASSAGIPRVYHSTALLLPDARVLSMGGNVLNNYPDTRTNEIYSPPYLFKGTRPTITSAPTSVVYGQSFFVETPDAAAISNVTMLRLSSVTHAFNMSQHISTLNFSQATGGLNVVAPSGGTAAPPGRYLLFILNASGVPSVGSIVQVGSDPAALTLTSLSPSSAVARGPAFTLTVNGSNFVSGSVVLWNGANRTTTFVNATQLTAPIPAADIAAAGSASVTVQNPGGAVSNALTFTIGAISREVWTGITGTSVSNIPVGAAPNLSDTLPSFEAPTNWADNYGTRMRGYITAPVTGSYTFWIASDNNSELWLSINDNPANKVRIGWVSGSGWTDSRQWNKYSSQKSAARTLTQGQRYYVEALQKEAGGGDNLAVGWAKPGESTSAPSEVIPDSVLSPFSGPAGPGPEINVLGNGTTISDGATTPSGSDHTDFGSTDFPNGTVTRTFTIQNLGTESLTVNPVTLSGAHAADFSVIVQPASAVAAGGNTSFQVRFNPSAVGTRSATLSVGNNDANENPYDFALQGTGATAGSGGNLVTNPSFDAEAVNTQTPSGWSEWGSTSAGYTEATGHTGARHYSHWRSSSYQIYTYQVFTGLTNGLYTLKAWARGGGGYNQALLEAKDFDSLGTKPTANIPTNDWTQLIISNINVQNGQCTIGFWTDAPAGKWVHMDDVEFYKQ